MFECNMGGARPGSGAPKKPEHLKKIYKIFGIYPRSFEMIKRIADKTGLSRSMVVEEILSSVVEDDMTKTLKRHTYLN